MRHPGLSGGSKPDQSKMAHIRLSFRIYAIFECPLCQVGLAGKVFNCIAKKIVNLNILISHIFFIEPDLFGSGTVVALIDW